MKKKLQSEVQKIARLIDRGLPCTTSQGVTLQSSHGGHVLGHGAHIECRFNLHNIHIQSAESNLSQKDDQLMLKGIERVYGTHYKDFVDNLRHTPVPHMKYDEAYKSACQISKMLETISIQLSPEQRIEIRNYANDILGIYPEEFSVYKNPTGNQ